MSPRALLRRLRRALAGPCLVLAERVLHHAGFATNRSGNNTSSR